MMKEALFEKDQESVEEILKMLSFLERRCIKIAKDANTKRNYMISSDWHDVVTCVQSASKRLKKLKT